MLNKKLIEERLKTQIIAPLVVELAALEQEKSALIVQYIEEEDAHKAHKYKQEANIINRKIEGIQGVFFNDERIINQI